MRDRVKVAFYVALYHPLVAAPISLQAIPNVCYGIVCASVGPESIGMDAEICFPYGFQDHPKGFLYNPVKQDWDTEWSLFIAVWFGYVHPSHRTWFKGFGFECGFEFFDVSIKVSSEVRHVLPVYSCRLTPFILLDVMHGHS